MTVRIRPAQISDAADIGRLTSQLGYDLEAPVVATRLSKALSRTDQHFLVAALDQRVVGWAHVVIWEFLETGRFGMIAGLVVDSPHRRTGIGRSLMEHAEAWIRDQKCSGARLWSSAGRTAAHRFYEALGYTNIKTQYSFAKALGPEQIDLLKSYVPHVEE